MTPARHHATLLTPYGAGAIAVIRLVGPDPISMLDRVFVHAKQKRPHTDGKHLYGRLFDGDESLDEVVVSAESISANETSLEICCHGGTQIVHRILELLGRNGAEIEVDPGSGSAFAHWQPTNLIEYEALLAISNARTVRAARYAAKLRNDLLNHVHGLALKWNHDPREAIAGAEALLSAAPAAQALLGGLTVSLIGPPNTGKSTLMNALLGRKAAITSPIAGTTRDWVRESADFEGVPVTLMDTAGQHGTSDSLEAEAIALGVHQAGKCDAAFLVLDGTREPLTAELALARCPNSQRIWVVANKNDLDFVWSPATIDRVRLTTGCPPLIISARNFTGCEFLKRALIDAWGLGEPAAPTLGFFTARQIDLARPCLATQSASSENPLAILYRNLAGRADYAL